jgi:hypothetical protein
MWYLTFLQLYLLYHYIFLYGVLEVPFYFHIGCRLAIAHYKIYVGQKRSKMKIPGSPVQLNGEQLLAEGREELKEAREYLAANNTPIKIK